MSEASHREDPGPNSNKGDNLCNGIRSGQGLSLSFVCLVDKGQVPRSGIGPLLVGLPR